MNRRLARETVFCLIYEMEFHKEQNYIDVYNISVVNREIEEDEYIEKVFFGIFKNLIEIDSKISESAVGWKIERISKVTLAIMRLCVYEMMYVEDVPTSVAMNEAVELAKKYDHDNAPAFINGIVNAVAQKEDLKEVK